MRYGNAPMSNKGIATSPQKSQLENLKGDSNEMV
jgi:hypothetical protein